MLVPKAFLLSCITFGKGVKETNTCEEGEEITGASGIE